MKKERNYIARLDDGHDYSTIEYMSEHRANSKANREDCMRTIVRRYGYNRAKKLKILAVHLGNH